MAAITIHVRLEWATDEHSVPEARLKTALARMSEDAVRGERIEDKLQGLFEETLLGYDVKVRDEDRRAQQPIEVDRDFLAVVVEAV